MHPFAPQMTGRPASELPIDKLKVPAGFKVEVWVDGIPEMGWLSPKVKAADTTKIRSFRCPKCGYVEANAMP